MAEKLGAKPPEKLDESLLKSFVEQCEAIDDQISSIKARNAGECGAKLKEKGKIINEAKLRGFNQEAFKALLARRKLDAKAKEIRAELSTNELQAIYDSFVKSLGHLQGTPLGEAAIKAAPKPTPDAPGPKAEAEVVAANEKALAGITQLKPKGGDGAGAAAF